jgi:hypothetical protein
MKEDIMQMTTVQRRVHATTFTRDVRKKILASDAFTPEEKAAAKFASALIGTMAESWQKSGRKREKIGKAGRDALYLRQYRAGKALEASREAGASRAEIKRLQSEFDAASADFEAFKRRAKRGSKKVTA